MLIMKDIEWCIRIIIILIAYFSSVPVVGYFRAWMAQQMGDDTPEQLGFLTFNPTRHASVFGLIFIAFAGFGLGNYIPINLLHIHGPWRRLKIAVVYLSDSVASMVLAIFALFALIVCSGCDAMFLLNRFSSKLLASTYPGASSWGLSVAMVLLGFVYFNSLLATFNFIINLFYMIFFSWFEHLLQSEYVDLIVLLGPLVLLYILFYPVEKMVLILIAGMGNILGGLVGVLS